MKCSPLLLLACLLCCSCSHRALTATEKSTETAAETTKIAVREAETAEKTCTRAALNVAKTCSDTLRDSVRELLVVDTAGRVIYRERTAYRDRLRAVTATTRESLDSVHTEAAALRLSDTLQTTAARIERESTTATAYALPWYKKALQALALIAFGAAVGGIAWTGLRARRG